MNQRTFGGFPLTAEQNDVIDKALTGKSLKITAYAGAGKTSTLVALATEMQHKRGLYLAFNADAKKDAAKKFKGLNVEVKTTHGLAFAWFREQYPSVAPKGFTYRGFEVADMFNFDWWRDDHWSKSISPSKLGSLVVEWINRFCNSGDTEIGMQHAPLSSIPGRPLKFDAAEAKRSENRTEVAKLKREILTPYLRPAADLWKIITSNPTKHPISHDIYLKMWSRAAPALPVDYLMLDEAQDTNGAVIAAMSRLDCQKIIVGDSHQQIYSFRGASDAMTKMPADQVATLSKSFRYGEVIGQLANEFLNAAKGVEVEVHGFEKVDSVITTEAMNYADLDAVLCRTNESALATALILLDAGLRPKLIYGTGKAEMVRKLTAIQELMDDGVTQAHPDYKDFNGSTFREYLESPQGAPDNTLNKMLDRFGMEAIEQILEQGARYRKNVIVVTTAHKSKGLEWDRVALAEDFPETLDDYSDDEANLLYVALTRAKKGLDVSRCPVLAEIASYLLPEKQRDPEILAKPNFVDVWEPVSGLRLLPEDRSFIYGVRAGKGLDHNEFAELIAQYATIWKEAYEKQPKENLKNYSGRRAANQWLVNGGQMALFGEVA